MTTEMYRGLIEILEIISEDKSWNDDEVKTHISWLKGNMYTSEGMEMDKKNEEEFKNREEQIKAYIKNYIECSGLDGKILEVEYEKIIGKRDRTDKKKYGPKNLEYER